MSTTFIPPLPSPPQRFTLPKAFHNLDDIRKIHNIVWEKRAPLTKEAEAELNAFKEYLRQLYSEIKNAAEN